MNTDPKDFMRQAAAKAASAESKLKETASDVMDKVKDKTGNLTEGESGRRTVERSRYARWIGRQTEKMIFIL